MDKPKQKTQFATPSAFLDWILATICIIGGGLYIRASLPSDSWRIWIENAYPHTKLAKTFQARGLVRLKRYNHSTWQDIPFEIEMSDGDELVTDSESTVSLSMGRTHDQVRINLSPQTRILVHASSANSPPIGIANFLRQGELTPPTVELEKGKIIVLLAKTGAPLDLNLMNRNNTETIHLKPGVPLLASTLTQSPILSITSVSQADFDSDLSDSDSDSELSHGTLQIPRVISPLHGTGFVANPNSDEKDEIELHWNKLPSGLKAILDLKRAEDPNFTSTFSPTSTGVTLNLPEGHYSWRLRTSNATGNKSEWTSVHEFSIQETMKGKTPIVLLESEKMEEVNLKKARANEEESAQNKEKIQDENKKQLKILSAKAVLEKTKKLQIALDQFNNKDSYLRQKLQQEKYQEIVQASELRIQSWEKETHFQGNRTLATSGRVALEIHNYPHPTTPAENSDLRQKRPIQFTWENDVAIFVYHFQLATDAEFKNVLHEDRLQTTSTFVAIPSPGTYYWRIRGSTKQSSTSWSLPRKLYIR